MKSNLFSKFIAISLILMASLSQAENKKEFEFSDQFIHFRPKGMKMTAGYFTLKNLTSKELILTAVKTACAKTSELHDIIKENGVMKMKKMESVSVPAKESVTFKPRGKHIMLIGITEEFYKGNSCQFELTRKNGAPIFFTANIKK